jgi:protein disulfide-isomerase A6
MHLVRLLVFSFFFSNFTGCGHCKNLAPHYKNAAQKLLNIVPLGAVDCDNSVNQPICGQYGIQGI